MADALGPLLPEKNRAALTPPRIGSPFPPRMARAR